MPSSQQSAPPPRLSLVDLLTDDRPSSDLQAGYGRGLEALQRNVIRDLHWLLNSRLGINPDPDGELQMGKDPLRGTVRRFGIPDITTLDLKLDSERAFLQRRIEDAIRLHEPRLDSIRVTIIATEEVQGRTRFRIDARLRVEPDPIRLSLNASVVWKNRAVEVE